MQDRRRTGSNAARPRGSPASAALRITFAPTLPTPMTVLGYCDNIPELMRAADLLVTKAGPRAIAEASLAEAPVVIYDYIPGQEYGNLKYVEKNRIGVVALTASDVVRSTRRIVGNLERLQTMRDSQAVVAPRGSARRIAELIANYAFGERTAAPPPKPVRAVVAL